MNWLMKFLHLNFAKLMCNFSKISFVTINVSLYANVLTLAKTMSIFDPLLSLVNIEHSRSQSQKNLVAQSILLANEN